ncbi:MAG: type II CAAX endopeptidase family protein [Chloroflexota bacterium]|nr:type II CAAX endopeptidase family protein [Chloroflexota bacterium]MDE2896107.1 type II CAAX endopeptidase family protein [Chloroflexota bacterium]
MTQSQPTETGEAQTQPEDRGLAGFRLVGWGLICTLAWLVVLLITGALVAAIDDADEATSETGLLVFVIGQGTAGLLGWFILPRLILRRRSQSSLISWRRPTGSDVAWAIGGLLAIYAVLYAYTAIITAAGLESLEPQSTIDDDRLFVHTSVMVALGILVIVCAPIYEEAFARGFVLGGLRPHWGLIPAFVVSAAVFSALHADLGSLIPFAIAGVVLGIVYIRTQSLTAASIAHFGFNVIGFSATLVQQLG